MGDQLPDKQATDLDTKAPTSLHPEKLAEEMAKKQLDFKQKSESKEAKQEKESKKTEIMTDAAKARADIMVDQPETPKAKPTASQPAAPAQPVAVAESPAPTSSPVEEKVTFASLLDSIKNFFIQIKEKFYGLLGIKVEKTVIEPVSSEQITGPDSTSGLKGHDLAINPQFKQRAEQIAKKIGVSLADLYAIFNIESGLDPKAINPTSGASGLIQWMPKYAPDGTTIDQIRQMTGLQQLEYVDKHFSAHAGKIKSFSDMYALVFWPAAVGKPADYIFGAPDMEYAKKVATQNAVIAKFSRRPDGLIDKAAFDRYANSKRPADSAFVV